MTATVRLSGDQIAAAQYAVRDLIARRRLAGAPVPPAVLDLWNTLASGGDSETESPTRATESDEMIGVAEAAAILGCSEQWVRRIHADLDGRKVGRRPWVFRRRAVEDYAEGRLQ